MRSLREPHRHPTSAVDGEWFVPFIANPINADSVLLAGYGAWDLVTRFQLVSSGVRHWHAGDVDDISGVFDEPGPDFLPVAVTGADAIVVCIACWC